MRNDDPALDLMAMRNDDPMIIPPAGAPPEAPAGAPAGGPDTPILPFEDVPYPSFQIDGGCIITRWNDALVELTGVCRDVAIVNELSVFLTLCRICAIVNGGFRRFRAHCRNRGVTDA